MARYIAIEPLLTKAGRIEPGESVELGESQAQQLLELGAIEPRKTRAKSASEDFSDKAEAERLAAEAAEAERLAAEAAAANGASEA